jgi:hypothetical protein
MEKRIKSKERCDGCGGFAMLVKQEDIPKEYHKKPWRNYDKERIYFCKTCKTHSLTSLPRYKWT